MYATIDRKNYQNNQYNHHILTQQEKHKQMYNKYVQNNISTVENLKKTSNTVNIIFAHFKVKKRS